jgi:hypothetical protein
MPSMAVDVMHCAAFELKKSCAFHILQTNPTFEIETKTTYIFVNAYSLGDGVGLPLQCPKMQSVLSFFLLGQHFFTAQFH